MQFLITGGTGFIGRQLVRRLLGEGHDVVVLSRQPARDVCLLLSDKIKPITSLAAINPSVYFDAVINLAGEGILDKRWSHARKKVLLDSRIGVTTELVDLFERMENRPGCLISASAVGFYGIAHGAGEVLDESAQAGSDFAATLCNRWEQVALRVEAMEVRTCIVRIGVVLHPDGGALQKMLPAFRLGLGGPIGDGQQIMPWIHMDDMLGILLYLASHQEATGVFNAVAPQTLSNKAFARALGHAVRRPAIIPAPKCALELLLGESAQLLTNGSAVIPERLKEAGFTFAYPDINQALASLLA